MQLIDLNSIIKINPNVLATIIDDEVLLLSHTNGEYYHLNATGSEIWKLAHEEISVQALCKRLAEIYQVDYPRCEAEALRFIEALITKQMLCCSPA